MIKCLLLLAILVPAPACAEELKIATWNLNWLTLRTPAAAGLPNDVKPREPGDFDRLTQYALELNADVIAIQEVDGWDPAMKLFPRDRYTIQMTHDHVVQRVGIVLRRGLHYDRNPDVTAIEGNTAHHLRSGADLTLHLHAGDLRLLAIHLKTGCPDQPLERSKRRPCVELHDQIEPLQAWIAARQAEGVPFLVLGDFNRRMDPPDQFIVALRRAAPLTRVTEGRSSPCWGNEAFIDHILAGGPAQTWIVPDSMRVLTYREQGQEWKERLSDHCPVSVRLNVPEAPVATGLPATTASPSVPAQREGDP